MAKMGKKRLLVAVDGSEQALEAVRYVSCLKPAANFQVVLFHVLTRIPESFWDLEKEPTYDYRIVSIGAWEAQQKEMIENFMRRARELLDEKGFPGDSVVVDIHERQEGIARDIVTEGRKGYDAVIVGRRGLSELKDVVLGNVATKLVERLTEVPVWVVGGSPTPGKFLLCMDNSEGAHRALDYFARMVEGMGPVEVTLFHAIRGLNVFRQVFGKSFGRNMEREWLEKAEKELESAERALEPVMSEAASKLERAGIASSAVRKKIVKGVSSRAGAVVEEANAGGYDTIIVGRRGLSKVKEFFIGRVSNKVIQMAREKAIWVVC